MNEERAFLQEAMREQKRMADLAAKIWSSERERLTRQSGDGYRRWTDKSALGLVRVVTRQAIEANASWFDIEEAVKIVAAQALWSPRKIFDVALERAAARTTREHTVQKMDDPAAHVRRREGLHQIRVR